MNILSTGEGAGRSAARGTTDTAMVPATPTPSARLLRAAAAERDEVRRHRERLVAARDGLRAELAQIEASLRDLDERDALLDRLAGVPAVGLAAAPVPTGAENAGPSAT